MSAINELYAGVQATREAWAEAMKEIIPVGTVVEVFIGRAPVEIEVGSFNTRSYHEGHVYGTNTKTGSRRQCHYTQIIGYEFSEYDRFGSLHSSLAEQKRIAAQAKQGDAA